MIDLSRYVFEALRNDEEFILYRGQSKDDASQVLCFRLRVLVQFPINGCSFGKMIFWFLCRQDLRPERWNGHFFFRQRSEVELVFLDLLC